MPVSISLGVWIAVGAIVAVVVVAVVLWLVMRKRTVRQVVPAAPPVAPVVSPKPDNSVAIRHARDTSQLAAQQIEILDQMENIAEDPDLLFYLFRVRHLTARINHEAELLQVISGQALRGTDRSARKASAVARSGMEAVAAFENIRLEIKNDSVIAAGATYGLSNLLTQLLDRAVEAERFGKVHLVVDVNEGRAVFEVIDHGHGMTEEASSKASVEMEAGLAGRPLDLEGGSLWPVGAVLRDLAAEISLTTDGSGSGSIATVTVAMASMGRSEDIVEKVGFGSALPPAGFGAVLPSAARKNAPERTAENPTVARFMAASKARGEKTPLERPVTIDKPVPFVPPLYQEAIDRMELRSSLEKLRNERREFLLREEATTERPAAPKGRRVAPQPALLPAGSKWPNDARALLDEQL